MQSGVCTYTGQRSGSEARQQVKTRRTQCFIFEGGTLRNWLAIFSDSSFGNKASFSFSFFFFTPPPPLLASLPSPPPRSNWHRRGKHRRDFDTTFGLLLQNATCFPVSGVLCAPRSLLHREQQQQQQQQDPAATPQCLLLLTCKKAATQVWLPLLDFISDLDSRRPVFAELTRCQHAPRGEGKGGEGTSPVTQRGSTVGAV